MAYPCACNPALRREARNWAACVQASDALTATSRLHSSNRTCCVAPRLTINVGEENRPVSNVHAYVKFYTLRVNRNFQDTCPVYVTSGTSETNA